MAELGRRVNSIIVKNLPTDYDESHLEQLFSKVGRVLSSKVLPANANFDGGCGFVNFADQESCSQAVEMMDNLNINGFILRVSHSMSRVNGNHSTNSFERTPNGIRANGDSHSRATSSLDGSQGTTSPNRLQRFANFRPASERSSKGDSQNSSTQEFDNGPQTKPLWNSQAEPTKTQSPVRPEIAMTIAEHEPLAKNNKYHVYLSNLEVPNVIFAATLDDYCNATMLINEMNKHEQLTKVQATAYKNKLSVGQYCAALFNGDWYRARVVGVEEQRALVQYIDWGNSNWCDAILEIRPLPNEFYKYPILCFKCVLEGIPATKPNDEQTNVILNDILVLDTKLEMTVVRVENGVAHVQLALGEKNLNQAIRALFVSTPVPEPIVFDQRKPTIKLSEMHQVQLTTVDPNGQCFHVLLFGEPMTRILNVLKDWNASKKPLKSPPKANTLVCAQYEDGLWYRAWIESITDKGYEVYFVDFGNEETVSMNLLSECPDSIQQLPWQSIQVKFANIQMEDDERYLLLRKYDTQQLEMKVLSHDQDVYTVELFYNGKLITDPIIEARQKKLQAKQPVVFTRPTPTPTPTPMVNGNAAHPQVIPTTPTQPPPLMSKPMTTVTPTTPINGVNEENLGNLIQEQRRQNRLLEQVVAAINTTNALLAQLVQRSPI